MKKKLPLSILPLLSLVIILIFLSSRNKPGEDTFKRSQLLLGTIVQITVFNIDEDQNTDAAVEEAFKEIKRLEGRLGRHQEGSDIWNVNAGEERFVKISEGTLKVINEGLRFSTISEGAFDITLGRLSELWNFEEGRTVPPDNGEILELVKLRTPDSVTVNDVDKTVKTKKGVHIDLGGIAKGSIIDAAANLLLKRGIKNFIINAGGDMMIKGKKGEIPWRVGIQHPRNNEGIVAHMDIEEESTAIVTSGDYERFFVYEGKRYHHILDPSTGYPAEGLMSVTIKASDAKTADAISTAVFVMGLDKGLALIESIEGVEGMLIDKDQNFVFSKGLKGKVVIR